MLWVKKKTEFFHLLLLCWAGQLQFLFTDNERVTSFPTCSPRLDREAAHGWRLEEALITIPNDRLFSRNLEALTLIPRRRFLIAV